MKLGGLQMTDAADKARQRLRIQAGGIATAWADQQPADIRKVITIQSLMELAENVTITLESAAAEAREAERERIRKAVEAADVMVEGGFGLASRYKLLGEFKADVLAAISTEKDS